MEYCGHLVQKPEPLIDLLLSGSPLGRPSFSCLDQRLAEHRRGAAVRNTVHVKRLRLGGLAKVN
jgi:hypothetical protein